MHYTGGRQDIGERDKFPSQSRGTMDHVDGSSSSSRLGAGLILARLEGDVAEYAILFDFPTINNEVEYEALIAKLKIAKEVESDSSPFSVTLSWW